MPLARDQHPVKALALPAKRSAIEFARGAWTGALMILTFVTPYPPGFPVLVPGQVISAEVIEFMQALDTREIHGYRPEIGYRVFTEAALGTGQATAAGGAASGPPPPPIMLRIIRRTDIYPGDHRASRRKSGADTCRRHCRLSHRRRALPHRR